MRRLFWLVVALSACESDIGTLFAPPNLYPPDPDLAAVADLSLSPQPDLASAHPDLAEPLDLAESPDMAQPDLQLPDLQLPDLQRPDLQLPDLSVDPDDVVHFVAGVSVATFAGSATPGWVDGPGADARFQNPTGIALDEFGNLYVAEYDASRLRRVDPTGNTQTMLVGQVGFAEPFALAILNGELYVQTDDNPQGNKNPVSGTIWRWHLWGGPAEAVVTGLGRPRGLAALGDGSLFVADRARNTVALLTPSPSPTPLPLAGLDGQPGYVDLPSAGARFFDPYGSAVLADGSVVVADYNNHVIRRVWLDGTVGTFAGDGQSGSVDGPRLGGARFRNPKDVDVDASGNVYVSDPGAHRIRRIRCFDGEVETLAGDGFAGFADGAGADAEFFGQESLVVTPDGAILYLSDGDAGQGQPHHRIRKLTLP